MDDVNAFLNWYLSPRTRVNRRLFNLLLSLVLLPFLILGFSGAAEGMQAGFKLAETTFAESGGEMLSDPMHYKADLERVVKRFTGGDTFPWLKFFRQLALFAFIPVCFMRARDALVSPTVVYAITVFLTIDMLEILFSESLGMLGWLFALGLGGCLLMLSATPTHFKPVTQRKAEDEQKDQNTE